MSGNKNRRQSYIDVLIIAVIAIVLGIVLIVMAGADPVEAFGLFFRGIFGTKANFLEVFVKACPLILTGLGCAVAFRTGFFNIGAEGQFYIGAMVVTIVSLKWDFLGGIPRIIIAFVLGFIAGGLWALIPAVLKAKFKLSEIIVTIMMNYIAINFLGYAVRSFLMDPAGNVPQSAKIPENVQLPTLITSSRFHAGVFIALAAVIVVYYFMEKTTVGYEMRAVGLNARACACTGISVIKNIVLSAFLSGGLAAIAGGIEVLAVQKKLLEGISSGCGYTAVLIALIAANKPLGVLATALFYAALQTGTGSMQRQLGVPSSIVSILIGSIVVLILCKELFHRTDKKKGKGN